MNRKICASVLAALICLASVLLTSCSNSSSKMVPAAATTITTSEAAQSVTVGRAFAPLAVMVMSSGSPTSGISVTFTAPSSGPSGMFANGTVMETDITNSNGVATSSVFSANRTAGTYTVTAVAAGDPTPVQFDLTNQPNITTATTYSFYLSGLEAICSSENYYALAGSVSIDPSGNVVAGEQDYNDAYGCTSPEPAGDTITGGTLAIDANGQGTLTLTTTNTNLGVSGTETLGVQFVNNNHALIIQFDGSATSSGSMDLQTLSSPPSGGYAFILSGVDASYNPVARGGVFSISGTSLSNGLVDVNDLGTVTTGSTFTGTLSTQDSFGRGTITGTGLANTIVYYVVGPEVIRIIDVDTTDSAVGSAFGQGAATFTKASLGSSVFTVDANIEGVEFAVAGMLTVPTAGTFQGVADNDEEGAVYSGSAIAGNYSISDTVGALTYNGYGNLTITPSSLGDFTSAGIYMTDPNLNLNDPNNSSGGGGALVLALDPYFAGGTGVVAPQTDTVTGHLAGHYAFGAQDYYTGNPGWEFDFVGNGSVAGGSLTGTGLVSDPFCFFVFSPGIYSTVPFSGTVTPDPSNPGRYTIPLNVTAGGSSIPFQVVIYQASGGQLFWIDEDTTVTYTNDQIGTSLWSGSLQQQGALTGLPAARRPVAKSQVKQ
jgi:hypothetical protein